MPLRNTREIKYSPNLNLNNLLLSEIRKLIITKLQNTVSAVCHENLPM